MEFLKASRKPRFIGVLKRLSPLRALDANTDSEKTPSVCTFLSGPVRQSLLSHVVLGEYCGIMFDPRAEVLSVFLQFISRLGQLP